jgi:hypothetical protein
MLKEYNVTLLKLLNIIKLIIIKNYLNMFVSSSMFWFCLNHLQVASDTSKNQQHRYIANYVCCWVGGWWGTAM